MGQRRLFAVVAVFFRLVLFDGLGGSGALSLLCGDLSLVVGRTRLLFIHARHNQPSLHGLDGIVAQRNRTGGFALRRRAAGAVHGDGDLDEFLTARKVKVEVVQLVAGLVGSEGDSALTIGSVVDEHVLVLDSGVAASLSVALSNGNLHGDSGRITGGRAEGHREDPRKESLAVDGVPALIRNHLDVLDEFSFHIQLPPHTLHRDGDLSSHGKALVVTQAGVHVVDSTDEGLVVLESGNEVARVIRPRTLAAGFDFQCALLADNEVVPVAEHNLGLAAGGFEQVGGLVGVAHQSTVLIHLLSEDETADLIAQGLEELLHAGVEHEAQTIGVNIVLQNGRHQIVRERSSQDALIAGILGINAGNVDVEHTLVLGDAQRLELAAGAEQCAVVNTQSHLLGNVLTDDDIIVKVGGAEQVVAHGDEGGQLLGRQLEVAELGCAAGNSAVLTGKQSTGAGLNLGDVQVAVRHPQTASAEAVNDGGRIEQLDDLVGVHLGNEIAAVGGNGSGQRLELVRHIRIAELALGGESRSLDVAARGVDALHSAAKHTVCSLAALRRGHGRDTGLERVLLHAVGTGAGRKKQVGILALGLLLNTGAAGLLLASASGALDALTLKGRDDGSDEFRGNALALSLITANRVGSRSGSGIGSGVIGGGGVSHAALTLKDSGHFRKDLLGRNAVRHGLAFLLASLSLLVEVGKHFGNQLSELFLSKFHFKFLLVLRDNLEDNLRFLGLLDGVVGLHDVVLHRRVIRCGGFQKRAENVSQLTDYRDERLQSVQSCAGDFARFDFGSKALHQRLDLINFSLVVHRPSDDGNFPELDFFQPAHTLLAVVIELNSVIADGQLIQNTVFHKRLNIAAFGGVADFAPDEKTLIIFTQFQRLADWQFAIGVLRQDFDAAKILPDGLGECAFFDDVAAAVLVPKHSSVPGELAALVRTFQLELKRLILAGCRRFSSSTFSLACHTVFLLSSEFRAS
nr:MAG TPA: hypothetical protein [Caudoviricetes sp.]